MTSGTAHSQLLFMCNAHKQSVGTHIQKSFITKVNKLRWASWKISMSFTLDCSSHDLRHPSAFPEAKHPFGSLWRLQRARTLGCQHSACSWCATVKENADECWPTFQKDHKVADKRQTHFPANQFSSKSGSQILKILVAVTQIYPLVI